MGQPRGHRSEPDLSHSPSSFCQHAIHHDSLPSTPHRSKPSSSHLHTPPRPDQHNPWRLPSAGAPVRHHGPSQSAAMQSHKGNSSETTRENFLYCYQGGLDFFGLGNSILSPNNPWFHAGSQVAQDQTWFGSLRRNGGSSLSPTASPWRTAASVTTVPSSPSSCSARRIVASCKGDRGRSNPARPNGRTDQPSSPIRWPGAATWLRSMSGRPRSQTRACSPYSTRKFSANIVGSSRRRDQLDDGRHGTRLATRVCRDPDR